MRLTRSLSFLLVAALGAAMLAVGPAAAVTKVGTPGPDQITGSAKADTLDGRRGDDTLRGRGDDDLLKGGGGRDGTHTAAWNKLTPQGEPMELSGVSVLEIADGKITEERLYFDPWLLGREWAVPLGTLMGIGLDMWKESRAIKKARRS